MITHIVRRLVRRAVPLAVRQIYAQAHRRYRDSVSGFSFQNESGGGEWPIRTELTQIVIPGQLFENKLSNLRRGAGMIDCSLMKSGSQWSFWGRVGKPSSGNGFVEGRNIVDGQLVRQVGGGLCQLSSLIHHLALLGGLAVVERHPHSIDIYREDERFTPLGADATVVWGFKDLRLKNPYQFEISIGCFLDRQRLVGQLRSEGPIPFLDVAFLRNEIEPQKVRVRTVVGGLTHGTTEYEQRPGFRVQ
jgi:vancomycin resistance protein VanW